MKNSYAKRFAKTLKAYFPQLGTQKELEGGDTVDALGSLYNIAKQGAIIHEAPANPVALSVDDWAEIYAALEFKKTSPAVKDDARWLKHLERIMKTIGPDGDEVIRIGVAGLRK